MILRDYQEEAVQFLVARKRGLVKAGAGAGKTAIGAAAIARIAYDGMKVGWLCNTIEQRLQCQSAIERTQCAADIVVDIQCAAAQPDFSECDLVVVDECHHVPAQSWIATIDRCVGIVWGLSATPLSEDPERNEIVWHVFKEFFEIERSRLEASGHLAKGKVYVHDLDTPHQFDAEINAQAAVEIARRCRRFPFIPKFEHERRVRFQVTQEFVQANEARNQCAISMAVRERDLGQSVLVLVQSIEHGEKLAMQIAADAALVYSKIGAKKRKQLIDEFRAGERKVLVATSLADEGLDVAIASRLILVAGGRSAGKLEQRAGRVLRPFEGKSHGVIHDFLDAGAAFAHAQAKARFRVYAKLGYEPEIISHKNSRVPTVASC